MQHAEGCEIIDWEEFINSNHGGIIIDTNFEEWFKLIDEANLIKHAALDCNLTSHCV